MIEIFGTYNGDGGIDWVSAIINIVGIVAAGLTSFLIFTQGNKRAEDAEKKRLIDLEQYVRISIPLLITRIDSHIANITEIEQKIKPHRMPDNFHYSETASLHSRSLSWISKTDLFKIYITDKPQQLLSDRIEMLSRFNNQLDYFDKVNTYWRSLISDTLTTQQNGYLQEFNKKFTALIKLYNTAGVELFNFPTPGTPDHLELLRIFQIIHKHFNTWRKAGNNADPYYVEDNLLQPLRLDLVGESANRIALEMVFLIDEASLSFRNMATVKQSVLNVMKDTKNKLERSKAELNVFLALADKNAPMPKWVKGRD